MTNILNQVQEFVESVTSAPETNEELLTLKKELANSIVEKLEKENPDILLSLDKELVAEYLVHEGIMDGLKDSILEKTLLKLSKLAPQLTTWREQINTIKTAEQLKDLETEIL